MLFAVIDDQSFLNKEKYSKLELPAVGLVNSLKINVEFFPPEGKKVNHASYVKIWEKEKNIWKLNSTHNAESILEFESLYKLKFDDNLQSKKSEIALEAEFIHCNYKGGQCAMEKYLGKVKRSPKSTNKNLSLDLKIK